MFQKKRGRGEGPVLMSGAVRYMIMITMTMGLALCCVGSKAWGVEYWGLTTAYANDGSLGTSTENTALGPNAVATGSFSTATGSGSQATGGASTTTGAGSLAGGSYSTAIGNSAWATGGFSTAIGYFTTASGDSSVALGVNSDDGGQNNVVSVGSGGIQRRIINVAAGVNDTDAVNVLQMNTTAANTIASANAYTDTVGANTLTAASAYADTVGANTLTAANTYTDTSSANTLTAANTYTDMIAIGTLSSASTYADTVGANTLASANAYTDTSSADTLTAANAYTDSVAFGATSNAYSYTDTVAIQTRKISPQHELNTVWRCMPLYQPPGPAPCHRSIHWHWIGASAFQAVFFRMHELSAPAVGHGNNPFENGVVKHGFYHNRAGLCPDLYYLVFCMSSAFTPRGWFINSDMLIFDIL